MINTQKLLGFICKIMAGHESPKDPVWATLYDLEDRIEKGEFNSPLNPANYSEETPLECNEIDVILGDGNAYRHTQVRGIRVRGRDGKTIGAWLNGIIDLIEKKNQPKRMPSCNTCETGAPLKERIASQEQTIEALKFTVELLCKTIQTQKERRDNSPYYIDFVPEDGTWAVKVAHEDGGGGNPIAWFVTDQLAKDFVDYKTRSMIDATRYVRSIPSCTPKPAHCGHPGMLPESCYRVQTCEGCTYRRKP